ncbi:MAG: hypothetical protein LBD94_00010 [Rickettsiales bacterium]|jgi:hypothetical protein|nr:hypothetical protein [Rickettsiales bacterium]
MKSRVLRNKIQGWLGGLFLAAGFAFIFMAFSLSAALADPVQMPVQNNAVAVQSPRASPRSASGRSGGAVRGAGAAGNTVSNASAKQQGTSREVVQTGRNVAVRSSSAANRTAQAAANATRNVRSRAGSGASSGRSTQSRSVVARAGGIQQASRVALTGSAIRASTSTTLTSLTTKLSPTLYNTLIDPNTGMLSADSYSNCLSSYYTCMDEICTARNPGQRRCACAGRVKTFNQVEATLQTAKEDLLKVSGELSLLIATKGESIHSAFELTEAEKSLNCVSYRDAKKSLGSNASMKEWCDNHLMLDTSACETSMNDTCKNLYGGTGDTAWMDVLNGADSDILTSLQTYAATIDEVNTINVDDTDSLLSAFNNVDMVVNSSNSIFNTETSVDTLAKTWGYELFQYAHNNVCGRVLDSCFNGVYEMCGNRPAAQGGGSGPYNMNSDITVTNDGNEVEFVTPKGTAASVGTAACFGYTTTSGDPYSTLRLPIADARLSVLQKYVLDANADCDVYGEELRTQAQNMAYQKIAATQLLQKKRLEFAQEKESNIAAALTSAKEKYKSCVNEIYSCYDQQTRTNANWSAARIKNYCAQSAEIPSCYEDMVCNRDAREIVAISDNEFTDTKACKESAVVGENTCRNLVMLAEILNGTGSTDSKTSKGIRESCLQNTPGVDGAGGIREFGKSWGPGVITCQAGQHWNGDRSVCEACPSDSTWNSGTNQCDCSGGKQWNSSTNTCN